MPFLLKEVFDGSIRFMQQSHYYQLDAQKSLFASIVSFCKLEALQFATAANHFALKYKLVVKANIAAMAELTDLRKKTLAA